jgi:predicted acylesterase/phospholipase RssA/CRP-like cAMP-binding protein
MVREMNGQVQNEAIQAYVKSSKWAESLSDEAIKEFSEAAELVECKENEVVHRAEDKLTAVYFVVRGRIQQTIMDRFGREILQRSLIRGAVFGLFSIARPDPTNAILVAKEPSSLIKLKFDQLFKLVAKHPTLQTNLYRLAGEVVRQLMQVDRTKEQPSVVAIVHQSECSRLITSLLVRRLKQIESIPSVWSDDPKQKLIEGIECRCIVEDGQFISVEQGRAWLREWSKRGRVLIDVSAKHELAALMRTIRFADTVLWCVRPCEKDQALANLKLLQNEVVGWKGKIHLVWCLDDPPHLAPATAELTGFVDHDFKIAFSEPGANQGLLLSHGLERIIHHLRGVQIGIALGGGAALGMAHLGVLKTLERHGIYVDRIAGTSAGAMVGTLYAHGLDTDYLIKSFVQDLRLPWPFRRLPGGGYWYLLYKYRRGQFDPMLRNYLGDARLEQLHIPMSAVTVDLVRGAPVVRETGGAVRAIVESINLPGLAAPILRGSEALVDGGLVNNIPADVLVSQGCNFVIASSVTAKLEQEFAGIRADTSPGRPKTPSTLKVMMRAQLVQNVNMNAVGVLSADLVIEPDVTKFDLSEFERTDELAEVGACETREHIQDIKQLLAELDPQLFS